MDRSKILKVSAALLSIVVGFTYLCVCRAREMKAERRDRTMLDLRIDELETRVSMLEQAAKNPPPFHQLADASVGDFPYGDPQPNMHDGKDPFAPRR